MTTRRGGHYRWSVRFDWGEAIHRTKLVSSVFLLGVVPLVVAFLIGSGDGTSPTTSPKAINLPRAPVDRAEEGIRAALAWFYGQRAYPLRHIPPGSLRRARSEARTVKPFRSASAPTATWQQIGPHPIDGPLGLYSGRPPWSGRVTSIGTVSGDPDTVYIGAAEGGVWKTTDGGVHWIPTFDDQPALAIGAVAVDPNDPTGNTVYAGTGEPNASESYYGAGLFETTDGGTTWNQVSTPFSNCTTGDVAVKAGTPSTIMVATVVDRGLLAAPPGPCDQGGGLWRTTDGGADWTRVVTGRAFDLAADPTDPDVWFLSVDGTQFDCCQEGVPGGLYRSTDGGATWSRVRGGLPTKKVGRMAVDVAPDGQHLALVVAHRDGSLRSVWTSGDGGASWKSLPTPPPLCDVGGGPQCGYDITIAVDPLDPATFYVGGVTLYRYTGNRAQPVAYGRTGIHVDFHALRFDSAHRLWIGNDGGMYRLDPGASDLADLNQDLAITQFYPGASGNPDRLLAGTQDNGTLQYSTSPAWRQIFGGDGAATAVDPQNQDVMYASTFFGSIYKTVDGGRIFSTYPIVGINSANPIAPISLDPTNPDVMVVGGDALFRSTNAGRTFKEFSPPFEKGNHFPCCTAAIGLGRSDPNVVYAGTWRGKLEVTTTGGGKAASAWTNTAGNGLPGRTVTDIAVDPANASTAYVTESGFNGAGGSGDGHVFSTTDAGGHWTDISGNLPDTPVNALALDARVGPPVLCVGTDVGVFVSTDEGGTWSRYSTGMPNVVVMDLLLDQTTNTLVAATHGRSAFAVEPLAPSNAFFLSVDRDEAGVGDVTSGDGRIQCGASCSALYQSGATVTLTASPAPSWHLTGWTGCSSTTGDTCQVTMQSNTNVVARFEPDETVPPDVSMQPLAPFRLAGKVHTEWSGTDSGSGIDSYDFRYRDVFGSRIFGYTYSEDYMDTQRTAVSFSMFPNETQCFSVRARDLDRNLSAFSSDVCTTRPLDDKGLDVSDGWTTERHHAGSYRGTITVSTTRGATLTHHVSKLKHLALVATTCPDCGAVQVLLDGTRVGHVVSLSSPRVRQRQIIVFPEFSSPEKGTLTLEVVSPDGKRVEIDGVGLSPL